MAAVSSSLIVAMTLRKLTGGMSKSATGTKLMLINSFVAAVASSSASFCNTTCMRQAEVKQGIDVYTSQDLNPESKVGISKICAQKAVKETAFSRMILSSSTLA